MTVGARIGNIGSGPERIPMFPHCCEAITKSDATTYSNPVMVMVLGAGDIAVKPYGPDTATTVTITISAAMVTNGPFILPFCVRQVLSTGTTATLIYGIW